jgi:hypothetical protein
MMMINEGISARGKSGQQIALNGLAIYVLFAPHSVAASAIGVAFATIGWVFRTVQTGSLGLRRSRFDLIIVLSLLWTGLSAVLSEEPRISIAKLTASWGVLIFYLTRATVTRKSALMLLTLLIFSGCAGALYSAFDLLQGRGVLVGLIADNSPFHRIGIEPGDTIWTINRQRVKATGYLDEALKSYPPNTPLQVGVISHGEQVERSLTLTPAEHAEVSPSGVASMAGSHNFRASGWTRHYETFAELMQMIALLALGVALAHLRNHGPNKYFRIAILATAILAMGLVFTAMRTVIVAFAIGASVIAFRSLRGAFKVAFTFALFFVLAFAAVVVWQTRDKNALLLGDPSSSLRGQVARVGLSRIAIHPIFGHGMDAMQRHWNEWGFPGRDMLHLHSTPLQLAFDRGLPMLALWLWLMIAFWWSIARAEKNAADRSDTPSYGILLGTLGALTAFLASSIVNYNYGDAEVAMMFWFLMGSTLNLCKSH